MKAAGVLSAAFVSGLLQATVLAAITAYAAPASAADAAAPSRLPADAALKSGMAAIRSATREIHSLVTHRRMPQDGAHRYADKIRAEVAKIRAASSRPPEANQAVERLMGQILAGADAIAGVAGSIDAIAGIIAIDEALAAYGTRFGDPDWIPLRTQ